MFAGVGIIGALASILASLLVSPAPTHGTMTNSMLRLCPAPEPIDLNTIHGELMRTREEIAELLGALITERK